jgi:hypothetical protein
MQTSKVGAGLAIGWRTAVEVEPFLPSRLNLPQAPGALRAAAPRWQRHLLRQ